MAPCNVGACGSKNKYFTQIGKCLKGLEKGLKEFEKGIIKSKYGFKSLILKKYLSSAHSGPKSPFRSIRYLEAR